MRRRKTCMRLYCPEVPMIGMIEMRHNERDQRASRFNFSSFPSSSSSSASDSDSASAPPFFLIPSFPPGGFFLWHSACGSAHEQPDRGFTWYTILGKWKIKCNIDTSSVLSSCHQSHIVSCLLYCRAWLCWLCLVVPSQLNVSRSCSDRTRE